MSMREQQSGGIAERRFPREITAQRELAQGQPMLRTWCAEETASKTAARKSARKNVVQMYLAKRQYHAVRPDHCAANKEWLAKTESRGCPAK